MQENVQIIIVARHQIYLHAMRNIVSHIPRCKVIGLAENGFELLFNKRLHETDIVLMDLGTSVIEGIDVSKNLLHRYEHLHIIGLALHFDQFRLEELFEAGISGVLLKNTSKKEIEAAICKVLEGSVYFPPEMLTNTKEIIH